MDDSQRASQADLHESLRSEVNSKCGSLRAASRLLEGLSARESDEMMLLMTEEALRLAKSIEDHRRMSYRAGFRPDIRY